MQLNVAAKVNAVVQSSEAGLLRRSGRHPSSSNLEINRSAERIDPQIARIRSEISGRPSVRRNRDADGTHGAFLSAIMEICSPCSVSSAWALRRWEKKFALSA